MGCSKGGGVRLNEFGKMGEAHAATAAPGWAAYDNPCTNSQPPTLGIEFMGWKKPHTICGEVVQGAGGDALSCLKAEWPVPCRCCHGSRSPSALPNPCSPAPLWRHPAPHHVESHHTSARSNAHEVVWNQWGNGLQQSVSGGRGVGGAVPRPQVACTCGAVLLSMSPPQLSPS